MIDIVLEQVRLTRNSEGNGLDHVTVDFKETSDFTRSNVGSTLREQAHTALRRGIHIFTEEINVRLLVNNFIITDVTISLTSKVKNRVLLVIERHDDTRVGINRLSAEGLLHAPGIPHGVFSLRHFSETDSEDSVLISHPKGTETFNSFVANCFGNNGLRTVVKNTQLLITATSGQLRAVSVPRHRGDQIRGTGGGEKFITFLNIPKLDSEISRRRS
jgi:hypothetical protein